VIRIFKDLIRRARSRKILKDRFPSVSFGDGVQVMGVKSIKIGAGSSIGDGVWINDCVRDDKVRLVIGVSVLVGRRGVVSTAGNLSIGDFCILAPDVIIADADHVYSDPTVPYLQQGATVGRSIVVEENCWFGMQSKVLGDLTIGRGSVVGAGSLVKRSLPPFSVAVGSPARVVRLYDFATRQWCTIRDEKELAASLEERSRSGLMPSREVYRQLLHTNAGFKTLDPVLAGSEMHL
jgi:acetyltransferase-like isoleucine patch superfamily enzyme